MLRADLADTTLASYAPDIPGEVDSLRDVLREHFASAPDREDCFTRIDRALSEINVVEFDRGAQARSAQEIAVRILQLLSRDADRHYRMRAICYLRLIGAEGRSFEEIAEELGTSRQNVDKCYRQIQDRLGGMPGRGDKSPIARAKYRNLRLGQRRPRAAWPAASAWQEARKLRLAAAA
jgi:hypothetical protein